MDGNTNAQVQQSAASELSELQNNEAAQPNDTNSKLSLDISGILNVLTRMTFKLV